MIINAHTHQDKSADINVEIMDLSHINITDDYFCLGIHPWQVGQFPLELLEKKLDLFQQHQKFFALGEIGLDKLKGAELKLQREYFRAQLEMTKQYKIQNIVLHNVKTYQESFTILREVGYQGNVILHGFNESYELWQQFQRNWPTYLSLGGLLLKKKSRISSEIKKLDLNFLLLETDDENISIEAIYQQACKLLNVNQNELEANISDNFMRIVP